MTDSHDSEHHRVPNSQKWQWLGVSQSLKFPERCVNDSDKVPKCMCVSMTQSTYHKVPNSQKVAMIRSTTEYQIPEPSETTLLCFPFPYVEKCWRTFQRLWYRISSFVFALSIGSILYSNYTIIVFGYNCTLLPYGRGILRYSGIGTTTFFGSRCPETHTTPSGDFGLFFLDSLI